MMPSRSRSSRPYFPYAEACSPKECAPAPGDSPHTILVLGGGGMKGMAHVGVIRSLYDAGVRIDAVVGTSIGALVGARFAMLASLESDPKAIIADLEAEALGVTEAAVLRRNVRALLLGGIAQPGLYDGDHYRNLIRRVLEGASFPSLAIPLRVNALSLINGNERWFGWDADRSLNLVDAVYASGALPLIFPPLDTADGDILVDGGLRTLVGVAEAVRWGAARVIAVDVSDLLEGATAEWRRLGLVGIHSRVVHVMAESQRAEILSARAVPTVHIRPDVGNISSFTFSVTPDLIAAGATAARAALRSPDAAAFHDAAPARGPRIRPLRRRA